MAARMENAGVPNRIHISRTTAEKLKEAGKAHWFCARSDEVRLKGKGIVSTFFVAKLGNTNSILSFVPTTDSDSSESNSSLTPKNHCDAKANGKKANQKNGRLIAWNVEILASRLREVVARRMVVKGKRSSPKQQIVLTSKDRGDKTCLDEMEDIISMPVFDPSVAAKESNPDDINLGKAVMEQLSLYVEAVSTMYRNNPFHNL